MFTTYPKGQSSMGCTQDVDKAIELCLRAGELGSADSYHHLGNVYSNRYVTGYWDVTKAKYYYSLAAIGGCPQARHSLGEIEKGSGNKQRAYKHFLIAARSGWEESLKELKLGYQEGLVTKDEYANALRECQTRRDEIKSDARERALQICDLLHE